MRVALSQLAVSKLVPLRLVILLIALASVASAAPPQFSPQQRVGLNGGDQWEPAVAADGSGRIYVLYPHYGKIADCKDCSIPTMLLVVSGDDGKSWQAPHVMLDSGSGQFDAQIAVDPADRRTVYAAWLQNNKRVVMLAKSPDSGATWSFTIAVRSDAELDKPALAVRGQNIYVAFNHEEEVWVAASQDGGHSFTPTRANEESRPGWSLLGAATVDPAGNAYLAWASYSKAGGARGAVNLYIAKSADAGKTWSANLLDVSAAAPDCKEEDCGEGFLGAQVALNSDADGTLYALWSAGSTPFGPQQIYFSSSTNAGENWLPRASVSSAATGAEHAFPAVVAGAGGDVRIAWMDARNSSRTRPYWNTYYRSSSNGGATWGDEIKVSGYVPGYRYIGKEGFRFPFGDYFGMAIDNHGDTHIVWGEGMNYQSPGSIWHASGR
ncbi:MAG: sialidase family protein [Terriglobales bacterium]|jgi:BNR repeat protein